MTLPIKYKKRLNYKLLMPMALIPIVLLIASHYDNREACKPITMAKEDLVKPMTIPPVTPTPITVIKYEYKTITKTVKYDKIITKYGKWHCKAGKCKRSLKIYGRML